MFKLATFTHAQKIDCLKKQFYNIPIILNVKFSCAKSYLFISFKRQMSEEIFVQTCFWNKMNNEHKRTANFTDTEESLLLCLVKKYQHILESKKTDCITSKQKNQCWNNIEKDFNGQSGQTYRSSVVLKKKYENLKKRTKKKYADERCYQLGTGGGPLIESKLTNVDNEIMDIVGSTRIKGLPSSFGGDANLGKQIW